MKSIDNYFSPHPSECRTSLVCMKHALLRLIEDWKRNMDNNFVGGVVLMDFSKLLTVYLATF